MKKDDDLRKETLAMFSKLADWAREHPGTAGHPDSLAKGGPGDADCISTFLASILHAAGMKCRFVGVLSPDGHAGAMFVEVFHAGFPPATKVMDMPPAVRGGFHQDLPNFQWIPVLPFHGWIHEGREILTWKRVAEKEL